MAHFREAEISALGTLVLLMYGVVWRRVWQHEHEVRKVPALNAMHICRSMWGYKRRAYEYLELRHGLDGEREREALRDGGAVECTVCDILFTRSMWRKQAAAELL